MALRIRHKSLRGVTVKMPTGRFVPQECRDAQGTILRPANSPEFWTTRLDSEGYAFIGEGQWTNMLQMRTASAFDIINSIEVPPTQKLGMGVAYGGVETVYLLGEEAREEVSAGTGPQTLIIASSSRIPHNHRSA